MKATAIIGLASLTLALAQQFPRHITSYESLGLSSKCFEALNTTVDCSGRLGWHVRSESPRINILDADGIDAICTEGCKQSLMNLRSKIQNDCDAVEDVLDHNLFLYPATYILDRYIYAYDMSCYKNRKTGQWCDQVLDEWRNTTDDVPHDCDDCILGPMEIAANSPLGHTEALAADFQSAVSSCGATDYVYASPAQYIMNPTAALFEAETTVRAATKSWSAQRMSSDCSDTYRVRENDTCTSIAATLSVPSRGLVEANERLDDWCGGLEVGQDLCLPEKCNVHFLTITDSCDSLFATYGLSQENLYKWNSKLFIECSHLKDFRGQYICVG
ncbi:LysM domain-containing protein [Colletotrichum truncatum]|uniref:LysM domain-containing protein n=1 Tax=Colletotrichum truncatum TaxID=5467 RepID=A0ACC3YNZ8_COLTU|nr:LysM domain-containing protein [Colletotrichum truncatum]KAF6782797.1 LysM domain-containing protein [Colletotrichum truncatum]